MERTTTSPTTFIFPSFAPPSEDEAEHSCKGSNDAGRSHARVSSPPLDFLLSWAARERLVNSSRTPVCIAIRALCTRLQEAEEEDLRTEGRSPATNRANSVFVGWSMRVTRAEWVSGVEVTAYGMRGENFEVGL